MTPTTSYQLYQKANGATNNNCPPVDGLWNQMYMVLGPANLIIAKC